MKTILLALCLIMAGCKEAGQIPPVPTVKQENPFKGILTVDGQKYAIIKVLWMRDGIGGFLTPKGEIWVSGNWFYAGESK